MPSPLGGLAPFADLRPTATGFQVDTLPTPHGAIFGAYTLLQQVLAAEQAQPGKRVLSLQTLFANGGRSGEPMDLDVQVLQHGRSFASVTLTCRQAAVVISRAEVLLTTDEDDYLRLQTPAAQPFVPDDWEPRQTGFWPGTSRQDPASGLDEVRQYLSLDQPVDGTQARALVALATEPPVLAGLLVFGGVPMGASSRVPANVLTQTITFLEPPDLVGGLVVRTTPSYAGRGRAHGQGDVTDVGGRLVATFSTTGVLRAPRPS
jgi:acyl-CoA thioesterase-2